MTPSNPSWINSRFRHEKPPFDEVAALAVKPIEDAGEAALARARAHEVRCPNNHRLAAVYRTRHGMVVTGKGAFLYVTLDQEGGDSVPGPDGGWISQDWHVERRHVRGKHRSAPLRVFLDSATMPDGSPAMYAVQCRCRTAVLYSVALAESIRSGSRKTIYSGER